MHTFTIPNFTGLAAAASSMSCLPSTDPGAALRALHRPVEDLWQGLQADWPGFTVEIVPQIDSTNSELMRRARQGQNHPTLLVALAQQAGRGRRGKTWLSPAGAALSFSLGVPLQPADWSGLSLAVGVSVAEQLHTGVQLKWPNDLWWQGRKLGGILIEAATLGRQPYAVIGIGLNVQAPSESALAALGEPASAEPQAAHLPPVPAAGLEEIDPRRDAGDWLAAVVPALARDLRVFESAGFATFATRFERRDALVGRAVVLSDGRQGLARGVAADGSLRLDTAQGQVPVKHAEVSVRPVPAVTPEAGQKPDNRDFVFFKASP